MRNLHQICAFKAWLKDRNESGRRFARRTQISEHTIFKAMRGEGIRCDTIIKILRYCPELRKQDFSMIDHKGFPIYQ